MSGSGLSLLRAAPYEVNGTMRQGKIHGIREAERTYCGQERRYAGGEIAPGNRDEVTCKGCLRSLDAQDRHEQWRAEYEERRSARTQEEREWWQWYSSYLQSPAWNSKRMRVLERAGALCEGCRQAPPVQVHHLTYDHAGNELLFELVALCIPCHQTAHPDKAIGQDAAPNGGERP